ncbi:MAG: GNAT family protein [Candidatus Aquilonibacter sp.]
MDNGIELSGTCVRLEPLGRHHIAPLVEASSGDSSFYTWSFVPQGEAQVRAYVEQALSLAASGRAVPFATVRQRDGMVIGTTRFFDLERWPWPAERRARVDAVYDTCEIGYTWLAPTAIRTAANTEAKRLMLTHAFETWGLRAVTFHTDARNARSRAAIERVGGQFEGILRSHRLAVDFVPRDSARYSIVESEWPAVKERLARLLPSA